MTQQTASAFMITLEGLSSLRMTLGLKIFPCWGITLAGQSPVLLQQKFQTGSKSSFYLIPKCLGTGRHSSRFMQRCQKIPASSVIFSKTVPIPFYRNSRLGFGGSFYDKAHINAEFVRLFVDHWFNGSGRAKPLLKYLQGIDFKIVDDLPRIHARIKCPIRMIWGQDDITFPVIHAREMANTMPTLEKLIEVEKSCFLLHEERPNVVAQHVLDFLLSE